MLTETSSSQQHFESMSSSSVNFNKQQQFQQAQNMAAGQRQHEALASLFRSLSSLASANSNNHNHQYPPQETVSLNLAANSASPLNRPNSSIANSIQSAVAAAVMQQQHQLNPPNPPQRAQLNASHHPTVAPSAYLCDQIKPAPNYSFLNQRQQVVSGLENDVQFSIPPPPQTTTATSTTMTTNSQQPSHRINYCTICNKELCNKYFMKTHMLKMHGINLEMEQQTMGRIETGHSDEQALALNDEGRSQDGPQNQQAESDLSAMNTQPADQRNQNSSASSSAGKGQQRQASKTNSKSAQAAAASVNKAAKTSAKQATSVLNGFAGNSMGGVVCDICNKELCSKYFLKVHKQNTHGIMTDYQDASQFVYPFGVNPLAAAAANSFMASAMPLPPVASVLPFPSMCFNQASSSSSLGQAPVGSDGCGSGCESGPSGHKKARSAGTEKTKRDHKQMRTLNNFDEFANETGSEKALEPFYRLMLAQQQQQQQQASGFDSINKMNAMMCYGAMGPFGPTAGISPAMVVEMILRNQHLFKRNNQQPANQSGRASSKDKNNNGDSQRRGTSGAAGAKVNSKDSNNSRYFIHYTEACPMCDRRFKSIKWLKTHMMNDHKQEIGVYMQMMMQSMCPAKSQPVPSIVQDQQRNQQFSQPNASYPMGIGALSVGGSSACTMLAQHHYQLDPSTRPPPPVSLCAGQQQQPPPPPPLSAQTTGLLQTIQGDHFSLIQNYLDQQRLVLQDQTGLNQTAINLSSPESGQHRLATLNNLNVMRHSSSSSSSSSSVSSSRSSSAKTSPHSMGTILNDDQQVDQLDLSIKCHNSESQSCGAFDNGPSGFLQVAGRQAKMGINEFFDDEDDDEDARSTRSSRHERAASEANA